ncbi:hypothetical protein NA56DRAFT_705595 [Hyaloscypha hepaticicola]|uniref:Uncharacterized protein n=1 Tax=Hyaloscypha hepaticicola TaxID=2082293 RepID=A0A2J6PZG6_9HELO|nr:hypothetical protein NA56DRAFT_705595 [Hyaloscypha hepaticicola]
MAFAWVRSFAVKHMLKRRTLAVLLLCMLSCVLIKYRTLAGSVAFMVFYICINNGVFTPQSVRVLCFRFAVEFEHRWPVLMRSSDDLKLLSSPASRALFILLGPGSTLVLPIVEYLIKGKRNISPIGIFSQTAEHITTTIDKIFGKKWLILIGISLYIASLWWLIGRMPYFKFMKCGLSAPQCSEHDLQRYKHALRYGFLTTNPLTKFKTGRKWTSCEPRRFGRWRKHRYRKEGKLCQRLRKASRVRARRSTCVN